MSGHFQPQVGHPVRHHLSLLLHTVSVTAKNIALITMIDMIKNYDNNNNNDDDNNKIKHIKVTKPIISIYILNSGLQVPVTLY